MTTPKPVMNSEVVNGGMKGPGGPMGLANRGGRGRGGGPRGGVSRFSGGPNDNINRNQQNQVRPQPNMNRPPPNINRGPIPNSNNRGGTTGPQQNGIINRPPQQQQNAVNRGPTLQNASTSRGPTLQNASTSRGPPPTRPPTVKSEEQKEVKSEQMENRGNPSQRGGNLGNRGGNRGFQRRDDNNPIRGGGGARNQDERLMEKVSAMGGPTYDLPPQEPVERKFSGHCRLYVGNLTNDITEDEVSALFAPFGQTAELFLNKEKNFAFIRLDYRASAEKAKRELDGSLRKGRQLKVRFAPHSAAVKVKNLTQFVSNELLEHAFSVFGEIERAYVLVDDRGKSMGEGIVEFARKPGAQLALRKCAENCFFLTSLGEYRDSCSRTLRPVIVESHEQLDDPDGYPEKNMFKKNPDFVKAREVGPRFATPDSFEHDYGTRWKQLYDLRKQKLDTVEREMKMEEEKLEAQMEFAKYEHETAMLREQLRQRELDRERQKREWEMKERQQEEQRRADEEMVRRQQEEMQLRMIRQEEDMRRRQQENSLFMQENAMRQGGGAGGYSPVPHDYDTPMPGDGYGMRGSGGPGNLPVDPKAFMDSYERGGAGSGGGMGGNQGRGGFDPIDDMGNRGGGMSRPRWGERRGGPMVDDYPSKRRRY